LFGSDMGQVRKRVGVPVTLVTAPKRDSVAVPLNNHWRRSMYQAAEV
jgi:hypothetical protein